jgi:hypothetical protein
MMSREPAELLFQAMWLLLLAMPVATATWTVTHEEIFREAREYCGERSRGASSLLKRKFFYVFTCEYCLSHYVSAVFVALSGFHLLLDDWRGYFLAFLATVGVANVYMSQFGRLRIGLKAERLEVTVKEQEVAAQANGATTRDISTSTSPDTGSGSDVMRQT